jgi:hypothetical protein
MFVTDLSFSNFSYLSKILLVASATAMPLMSRLDYSDKEKYILEFEDRDAYLQNFKNSRNKIQYAYLLTPQGMSEKSKLTLHF